MASHATCSIPRYQHRTKYNLTVYILQSIIGNQRHNDTRAPLSALQLHETVSMIQIQTQIQIHETRHTARLYHFTPQQGRKRQTTHIFTTSGVQGGATRGRGNSPCRALGKFWVLHVPAPPPMARVGQRACGGGGVAVGGCGGVCVCGGRGVCVWWRGGERVVRGLMRVCGACSRRCSRVERHQLASALASSPSASIR